MNGNNVKDLTPSQLKALFRSRSTVLSPSTTNMVRFKLLVIRNYVHQLDSFTSFPTIYNKFGVINDKDEQENQTCNESYVTESNSNDYVTERL